jgi:hypothetical protein
MKRAPPPQASIEMLALAVALGSVVTAGKLSHAPVIVPMISKGAITSTTFSDDHLGQPEVHASLTPGESTNIEQIVSRNANSASFESLSALTGHVSSAATVRRLRFSLSRRATDDDDAEGSGDLIGDDDDAQASTTTPTTITTAHTTSTTSTISITTDDAATSRAEAVCILGR